MAIVEYIRDILGTVVGGSLTAATIWIATNVVWASDFEQLARDLKADNVRVERLMLMDQRRDISRDIRALERVEIKTEIEADDLARLELELIEINEALDKLDGLD